MKVEVSDWNITLRPENDEDRWLLDKFEREGVIVGHTGSTLGINSPAMSDRRAIYINRDQQAILAYALGRMFEEKAAKSQNYHNLLFEITPPNENDPDYIQIEE